MLSVNLLQAKQNNTKSIHQKSKRDPIYTTTEQIFNLGRPLKLLWLIYCVIFLEFIFIWIWYSILSALRCNRVKLSHEPIYGLWGFLLVLLIWYVKWPCVVHFLRRQKASLHVGILGTLNLILGYFRCICGLGNSDRLLDSWSLSGYTRLSWAMSFSMFMWFVVSFSGIFAFG